MRTKYIILVGEFIVVCVVTSRVLSRLNFPVRKEPVPFCRPIDVHQNGAVPFHPAPSYPKFSHANKPGSTTLADDLSAKHGTVEPAQSRRQAVRDRYDPDVAARVQPGADSAIW